VNPQVRAVIDSQPAVPDLMVARARYTLGAAYALDECSPEVMLAAMAGAAYVAHLAEQLLKAKAITVREHAAVVKVAESGEAVFAAAIRHLEANSAPDHGDDERAGAPL
jgi:hypothetical protein